MKNNQYQNKKEIYEINEELQMKIFDRFLLTQILCTFVGSLSNSFIHGFILFPLIIFVSGVSSAIYLVIVIVVMGYISKASHMMHSF